MTGDLKRVRALVENHAVAVESNQPYRRGRQGRPLCAAIEGDPFRKRRGKPEIVRYLLAHGADIAGQAGQDPLRAAGHDLAMLRLLLDSGAQVAAKVVQGTTALHEAAHGGDAKVVRLLLERGAPIDARDEHDATPLHAAAGQGRLEVVKPLLRAGADVHARSFERTPLDAAVYGGHAAVARELYQAGPADLDKPRGIQKTTLLQVASEKGHVEVVRWLLDAGADPDRAGRDHHRWTPLENAAVQGHLEVIRLLLDRGAGRNTWAGVLEKAARHPAIVQLLVERGAPAAPRAAGAARGPRALERCDLTSMASLWSSLGKRPEAPLLADFLDRAEARREISTLCEIGVWVLPLLRLSGDVIGLRPVIGQPLARWPVVLAAHDGEGPRTIARDRTHLMPAYLAAFEPDTVRDMFRALHRFFGGEDGELALGTAARATSIKASLEYNVTAARAVARSLAAAEPRMLVDYLFARDWSWDGEEAEKVLSFAKVARRLVARPPSKAWLSTPLGAAAAALATEGDAYGGKEHLVAAKALEADGRHRQAYALYQGATMFAVRATERAPRSHLAGIARTAMAMDDEHLRALAALYGARAATPAAKRKRPAKAAASKQHAGRRARPRT